MNTEILGLPADKVVHFLLFFPFPIISYITFPDMRKTPAGFLRFSITVFIAGVCLGGAIELIQGISGYRSCDSKDLLADCYGLAASTAVMQVYEAFLKKRRNITE